jgi:ubiquinone/menaquinone biosynthesis C-methylase UbiE
MLPPVEELAFVPQAIAGRTRRMYDLLSGVYPASSYLFHSRAHKLALEMSGVRDGMRVLEIATGSGEMFGRLTERNRNGHTVGIDLSPNMAARAQRLARRHHPLARAHCQAVDARRLPFRDGTFDAVFCCYLFELLGTDQILETLGEIRRVLRAQGTLTTTLIGQNTKLFNGAYRVASSVIPSFWGRQVEAGMPAVIRGIGFRIEGDRSHRQSFYPSRVLCCRKE